MKPKKVHMEIKGMPDALCYFWPLRELGKVKS